jgi:hypothetical protein
MIDVVIRGYPSVLSPLNLALLIQARRNLLHFSGRQDL